MYSTNFLAKVLDWSVGKTVKIIGGDYYAYDYLFKPSYLNGEFEVYNTRFKLDDVARITIEKGDDITIELGR